MIMCWNCERAERVPKQAAIFDVLYGMFKESCGMWCCWQRIAKSRHAAKKEKRPSLIIASVPCCLRRCHDALHSRMCMSSMASDFAATRSRSVSPSTGLFAHSDGSRGVQACAGRSGCTFGRERQQDQSNFGCLYCKTFFNNLRCSVGSRKSAAIHFPARDRVPQNPQAVTRGARRRTCPNPRSAYERL